MKPLEGTSISILGLGASGDAAARLASVKGGEVYVSDSRIEPSAAAGAAELRTFGVRVELGGHDLERVARSDIVVVSPGIPPNAPVLQALRAAGCRWVSEPEFAFRFLYGPLIAVTGTNGKTTTAAMTAHILRESGRSVGLGGNIGAEFGPPVSGLALLEPVPDWFVVEISSFQLADIRDFRPEMGIVTNLAPDHLDRYSSVAAYYGDKARLFENATPDSVWILNGDSEEVEALAGEAAGRKVRFSVAGDPASEAFLRGGELVLSPEGGAARRILPAEDLPLPGLHNVGNALAACLAAWEAGVWTHEMDSALRTFPPLPNRLEVVGGTKGVRWVNDSKATNVAATVGALRSLAGPMVLLLGGKDKGEDLEALRDAMHSGVRAVIIYGEARGRLAGALAGAVKIEVVDGSFEEAVAAGLALAEPGDDLLLSPACSSFDMFESYVHRGRRFAGLARGGG